MLVDKRGIRHEGKRKPGNGFSLLASNNTSVQKSESANAFARPEQL